MKETQLEIVLQMKNLKTGKVFSLKNNSTAAPSARGEHSNGGVYNEASDFEKNGQAASICVSVIIAVAVMVVCGLLCYRQINRRRKQVWADQERARKESIRQAVRWKLQELETVHDSTPWLEQEMKPSSVTFGDVILINPSESSQSSPVPEHRKYYENYDQHQVYHQIHHHIVYGGSKRRNHHSSYRRDQQQVSYRQQDQAQRLQNQLSVDDDHVRDNKIRIYRNSDHHRFSVHSVEPRARHARKSLVNSTDIFKMPNKGQHKLGSGNKIEQTIECGSEVLMNSRNTVMMPNKDHHKLLLDSKVEPTTERDRKAPINSRDIIIMPPKVHHKVLLDRKVEPSTEYAQDVPIRSRDTVKIPNNDHHKLSLRIKLKPSPGRGQELSDNSKDSIQILNTDHNKQLLHRQNEKTTELAREVPSNSTDIIKMLNKDHDKLSLHKKLEPATEPGREVRRSSTNSSQIYASPNSNGTNFSTVSTNLPQNSRISSSRILVLHKGSSRRIVKRSSAVVPICVDAVY